MLMLFKQFFVSIAISAVVLSVAAVTTVAQDSPYPPSLRGLPIPEPPTIEEYVRSRSSGIPTLEVTVRQPVLRATPMRG